MFHHFVTLYPLEDILPRKLHFLLSDFSIFSPDKDICVFFGASRNCTVQSFCHIVPLPSHCLLENVYMYIFLISLDLRPGQIPKVNMMGGSLTKIKKLEKKRIFATICQQNTQPPLSQGLGNKSRANQITSDFLPRPTFSLVGKLPRDLCRLHPRVLLSTSWVFLSQKVILLQSHIFFILYFSSLVSNEILFLTHFWLFFCGLSGCSCAPTCKCRQ